MSQARYCQLILQGWYFTNRFIYIVNFEFLFQDLLEANDGIWDAPGCFPTGAADIKSCFCALLKIFADLLAWRGLGNPANATILTGWFFFFGGMVKNFRFNFFFRSFNGVSSENDSMH